MKNVFGTGMLTAMAISLTACASLGGSATAPPVPLGAPVAKSTAAPHATATPAANATASPAPNATATPAPNATATPAPNATATPTPGPSSIAIADQHIQPTLICIQHKPRDGRYFLRFGYNSNEPGAVQIAIDSVDGATQLNQVVVTPTDGSGAYEFTEQPALFNAGSGITAFDIPVHQKDRVTWYLDGNVLTATTNSAVQCP